MISGLDTSHLTSEEMSTPTKVYLMDLDLTLSLNISIIAFCVSGGMCDACHMSKQSCSDTNGIALGTALLVYWSVHYFGPD